MKKLLSILCAVCMICSCAIVFCACGDEDSKTVMNLSLNPEVEFVLDEDNKVITVNALNEEGNVIVKGQAFVGKSADEAVEIFISVSKDTGYLVSGSVKADENQISVSFSGDTKQAKKLFDDINESVKTYLSDNGIQATLNNAAALSKQYLQGLVKECAPYLSDEEIEAMSTKQLISQIQKSRKETADLYSQQLKDAYYSAKQYAYELAKFDYVKNQVNAIQKVAIETATAGYKNAIETLESTRKSLLLDETSLYQTALKAVNDAKADYLQYRNYLAGLQQNEITTSMTQLLDSYKAILDNAESALAQHYQTANAQIDSASQLITSAYNTMITAIQNVGVNVSNYADEMSASATQAITNFTTKFEQSYSDWMQSANSQLDSFTTDLKTPYAA